MRPRWLGAAFFALVVCFYSCPIHAYAQHKGQVPPPDPGIIRVNVNLVMVDATVKTKTGEVMNNLKPGDFEVRDNGVAQKIELFSRDQLPLDVVLVLDLSESTSPYLRPLRDAAKFSLFALKPGDQAALVTFSTDPRLRVPLTTNMDDIVAAFNFMSTGGNTNINDALFSAADYIRMAAPLGRRVVVLISDDLATNPGEHEPPAILNRLLGADAAVYNLKLPDFNTQEEHIHSMGIYGLVDIHKLMEQTGGESFNIKDVSQVDPVFRALIERIRTRYTLGYYTSADNASDKPHKLEVRLAPSFGAKGRNYTVVSKSGYVLQ